MDTSNDPDSDAESAHAGSPLGPHPGGTGGPADQGALEPFVPRPYPPRDPGESPLRGRLALVLDRDVERGRRAATTLGYSGCAARHHVGGAGLERVLAQEPWEVLLVSGDDAVPDDVATLVALPGTPALLCLGSSEQAQSLGLTAVPSDASVAEFAQLVGRALERRTLEDENRLLRERLAERFAFGNVITRDPALREVLRTLEAVADTRATVLITGETGTGKSLLARVVHTCSSRRNGAFVEVNCGALPGGLLEAELFGHSKGAFTGADQARAGRFEVAHGGTIFLDEIDSAPAEMQVKLLRVLQERRFERVGESQTRETDARVITATNAQLEARVADGTFREDLYWRLNVVAVRVPALRDRPRDLVPLAQRFLERFAAEYGKSVSGIDMDGLAALARQTWPGNVRQLEHSLERAVLLARGERLTAADLGLADEPVTGAARTLDRGITVRAPTLDAGLSWLTGATRLPTLREALEDPERRILVRALELTAGRRDQAAAMLDINRSTLFNKMRKYGLLERPFAP